MPETADFDEIWLDHPTPTEQDKVLSSNSAEWRGALSSEAYLRREAILSDQDLTRNGGITCWVLKGRRRGEESTVILAACETVLKRGLIRSGGKTTEVSCHGVASVFGIPDFRGKGYGFRLMKELAATLPSWQTLSGQSSFSVLYSDIGKKFYARNGWAAFESSHMHLKPITTQASQPLLLLTRQGSNSIQQEIIALPPVTQITSEQLSTLCAVDEALLRGRLEARPAASRPAIAMIPDARIMAWHHAREEFVAQEILGRTPHVKGALALIPSQATAKVESYNSEGALQSSTTRDAVSSSGTEQRRVWALWTRVYQNQDPANPKENVLYILRICIEPRSSSQGADEYSLEGDETEVQALMAVLREAQRQAKEWNTEHVEVWNPSRRVVQAIERLSSAADEDMPKVDDALKWIESPDSDQYRVIHHRESDSITALQLFDQGGIFDSGFEASPASIDWVDNDKFGWN